jgi:hypothetical protein
MHLEDFHEQLVRIHAERFRDLLKIIFQAFGVVFDDRTLFVAQADAHRVDPFRLLGIAATLGAVFALLAVMVELAVVAAATL